MEVCDKERELRTVGAHAVRDTGGVTAESIAHGVRSYKIGVQASWTGMALLVWLTVLSAFM
ncbi:hypothetical protein GCM10007392_10840 [Saccharospirillum salsuginis]|uniref:Uncharacterized protein n=1 Tax=Saccharospirillum salsuginis TaxID=418750 RepID=A0A918K2X4_9GAMM|nr:hypothetical protein GCM10007392_10840 [Saccharospirillum salsuginis]